MALRFDRVNLWHYRISGTENRNLIPMRPRRGGTPFRIILIDAPFFRGIRRMESYPRPSGLKLDALLFGLSLDSPSPNTYAASKRIETWASYAMNRASGEPPIPMPRPSGLKRLDGVLIRDLYNPPPIPMPRPSGLKQKHHR